MKAWTMIAAALALALAASGTLQAQTQTATTTQPPLTGVHPEDHGPITTPAPADDRIVVTAKRRPGLVRRVGHFFHRIFHRKRRWYATPSHRNHCKQRYRSYNPKTNSYRAYSGVVRKCVI